MNKKILVISPHIDDEVLGVGGYMAKKNISADVLLVNYTLERLYEHNAMKKIIGINNTFTLYDDKDGKNDQMASVDLIKYIDNMLEFNKYDELFIPYRSHHQDHQKIHDCCLAAIRLRQDVDPVPLVAMYEYPFINDTPTTGGHWYVDIEDTIDKKVNGFLENKSQVKRKPAPLNEESVRTLAQMRGMESGCEYAEKFYILRKITK
jgi:LmbE family N-acetylglucosaminyl deacetylase